MNTRTLNDYLEIPHVQIQHQTGPAAASSADVTSGGAAIICQRSASPSLRSASARVPLMMTPRFLLLALAVGALTPVLAAEDHPRPDGDSHKAEIVAKFDADHDGKLNDTERTAALAELAARMKEKHPDMFAKVDTDHDGVISQAEFVAGKKLLEERRAEFQGNGDGPKDPAMIAEMTARMKEKHPELFAKLDTDHDGALSKEELQAGRKLLDEARAKGRPDHGDKPDGHEADGPGHDGDDHHPRK